MTSECVEYTIRGVPKEVDAVLRSRAARERKSVNELVLEELTKATVGQEEASAVQQEEKTDFRQFAGKWLPDEGFDEMIAWQRRIDPEKWK